MKTKTVTAPRTPLVTALPGHQFDEHHSGIVDAPSATVWDALLGLRWADLRLTRPMTALRGLGLNTPGETIIATFAQRRGAVRAQDAPTNLTIAMVGKPWSPTPQHAKVATLDDVRAFDEPGWLKYGMEWALHPLADGRTLVETRTLCEATDTSARRRFGLYWLIVRAGSHAVRLDMIRALRRLTSPR